MQSVAIMGVVLVASSIASMPAIAFRFLIAGCAVDYTLGILLHFDRHRACTRR